MQPGNSSQNNRHTLLRYAALGTQLMVSLAVTVYGGLWLDKKLSLTTPLLVWILPLLVIFSTLYKLVKDTSSKK
ncbi:AtpZ/AtpI family protein [Foetidibacter luteolus]|uniref:AtpZ/AtpI family protein n=1 Tax=Foetidibacter luteolus TaxID=2608880 RepID=UPI00129AE206|nr:AtpZ/AtpI family protein [Foetidibacter luteolus]